MNLHAFEGRKLVTYIDQTVFEARRWILFRTPVQFVVQLLIDSDVHFCCEHSEVHFCLVYLHGTISWEHDRGCNRDG
jgi:hypothetical protein